MRHWNEFRDPRIDPKAGDKVSVDLGDGETELRHVVQVEHHAGGNLVRCRINDDTTHTRYIRIRDWREWANDSIVVAVES